MKSYFKAYFDNFRGFSKEVWILTLITYINRAGAMVMPFMSKYLHENLFFDGPEIGWIFASIGVGAMFGSWLGGKLTDKLGFYTIMLSSLFLTGFGIIALMFLYDFKEICVGLFLLTAIADMYKPAMYVAVSNFTDRKNRTRALTLIRLAMNLGIISGPIIAGILIKKNNYDSLFWVDGITCILAITIFMLLIDETKIYKARRRVRRKKRVVSVAKTRVLDDKNFILFLMASFITSFLFFQLFTTIPLYNTESLKLNQLEIGFLLALNGLLIFLFEMPLIGYLERNNAETTKIILIGSVFMASGFFFLLISKSVLILILSIGLITLGQILLFSFSNTFAFSRAKTGHEGSYMALYTMCFGAAQSLSPKIGLTVITSYNYFYNWLLMAIIGLIGISLYYKLDKNIKLEESSKKLEELSLS